MYATERQAVILRAAVAKFELLPRRLNMRGWIQHIHRGISASCDTVCCLAGEIALQAPDWRESPTSHGIFRSGERMMDAEDLAIMRLEIEQTDARMLFSLEGWPREFAEAYGAATARSSAIGRVTALKARVEHFIATGR